MLVLVHCLIVSFWYFCCAPVLWLCCSCFCVMSFRSFSILDVEFRLFCIYRINDVQFPECRLGPNIILAKNCELSSRQFFFPFLFFHLGNSAKSVWKFLCFQLTHTKVSCDLLITFVFIPYWGKNVGGKWQKFWGGDKIFPHWKKFPDNSAPDKTFPQFFLSQAKTFTWTKF